MSLIPPPPRPPSVPATIPDVPRAGLLPSSQSPQPSTSVASASVSTCVRVLEPPFEIVLDPVPAVGLVLYKHRLRGRYFSLGWVVYSMVEDMIDVPISSAPESGVGIYTDGAPEETHYSQYHPHLPGGRL